jgi:hypothetical protein
MADQTWVQKLAEAPCPDCVNGLCSTHGGDTCYKCPSCNGTGALVPELRSYCFGVGNYRPNGCNNPHCPICQGRGWELKPQAEQRVAMEDWALNKGYFIEHRPAFVCVAGITVRAHTDESREEALAHAICRASGD